MHGLERTLIVHVFRPNGLERSWTWSFFATFDGWSWKNTFTCFLVNGLERNFLVPLLSMVLKEVALLTSWSVSWKETFFLPDLPKVLKEVVLLLISTMSLTLLVFSSSLVTVMLSTLLVLKELHCSFLPHVFLAGVLKGVLVHVHLALVLTGVDEWSWKDLGATLWILSSMDDTAKTPKVDFFQDHCLFVHNWLLSRPFRIYTVKLASKIYSFQDHCVYEQNWVLSRLSEMYTVENNTKLTPFKTITLEIYSALTSMEHLVLSRPSICSVFWTSFKTIRRRKSTIVQEKWHLDSFQDHP